MSDRSGIIGVVVGSNLTIAALILIMRFTLAARGETPRCTESGEAPA